MARVTFSPNFNDAAVTPFPALTGLTVDGSTQSRALIAEAHNPLHLWVHELQPGASLRFAAPPVDHSLYVWAGAIDANGQALPEEGAVIVEHGGEAVVTASKPNTRLLHVHRPESHPERPTRAGGHVHIVGPEGIVKPGANTRARIWADSHCPTCEVWLHRTRPFMPNDGGAAHYHTADEIEFVLEGTAVHGARRLPVGSAYAADANTTYKVGSGPDGLSLIVFRATDNFYVQIPRDGSEPKPQKNSDQIRRLIENGEPAPAR